MKQELKNKMSIVTEKYVGKICRVRLSEQKGFHVGKVVAADASFVQLAPYAWSLSYYIGDDERAYDSLRSALQKPESTRNFNFQTNGVGRDITLGNPSIRSIEPLEFLVDKPEKTE